MTNHPENHNAKDAVLEKIRAGAVTMRPKFFFLLKALAVALVAALVLAVSIFLASFIFFGIRLSGNESLLHFGWRGVPIFLQVFPWALALIDLALIVLLEWLLRRFRFAYSRPVLLILIGLLIVVGGASIALERGTRFHDDLFEFAEHEGLPPFLRDLYINAHQRPPEELGAFRGVVIDIDDDAFVITHDDFDNDEDDGTWKVIPPPEFELETINTGDRVYVGGDEDDGVIEAYGIRILSDRTERMKE